jgi:hypothetical protein
VPGGRLGVGYPARPGPQSHAQRLPKPFPTRFIYPPSSQPMRATQIRCSIGEATHLRCSIGEATHLRCSTRPGDGRPASPTEGGRVCWASPPGGRTRDTHIWCSISDAAHIWCSTRPGDGWRGCEAPSGTRGRGRGDLARTGASETVGQIRPDLDLNPTHSGSPSRYRQISSAP